MAFAREPSNRRDRRRAPARTFGTVDAAVVWTGSASIAVAALAMGSLHAWVAILVAAVLLPCAVVALYRGATLRGPATLCLAAGGLCALQVLPVPSEVVRDLSPEAADIWSRARELVLPGGPRTASLSLAPRATSFEVLKWVVYAGAFVLGGFVQKVRGPVFAIGLVFGTAVAISLLTIGHSALGLTRVYGLYSPLFRSQGWPTGPLLNANNLAGFMNLGFFAGLGLLMSRREARLPKPALALGLALVLGTMLVSASRGGLAAFALAAMVFAGQGLRRSSGSRGRAGTALTAGGVIIGGVLLAVVAWSRHMTSELTSTDTSKLTLWGWSLELLRDFPLTGVGRGGFESAIGPYRTTPGHLTFAYAENVVIQFLCDFGVVCGASLLVGFAALSRPREFSSSTASRGAYLGVIALVVQNLTDLSLELMGVTACAALVLGSCRREEEAKKRAARANEKSAAILGVAGVGAITLAVIFARNPVFDRAALHADFQRVLSLPSGRARLAMKELLERAVLGYPGLSYPYQLGAVAGLRLGFDPMPWIGRALERDPLDARIQIVAAQVLKARGATGQAMLHLRLATEYEPSQLSVVARLAAGWSNAASELETAVAAGKAGVPALLAIADRVSHPTLREQLLRRAAERDPTRTEALARLGTILLRELSLGGERCRDDEARACRRDVAEIAARIRQRKPESVSWVRLSAGLLEVDGAWKEAEALLANECEKVDPRLTCLELRVQSSLRAGATAAHGAVVAEVRRTCSTPEECARMEKAIADAYLQMGWQREALSPLRRLAELAPSGDNWMAVGEVAEQLGNRAEAELSLRRALEVGPEGPITQRVQRLRAKLAAGLPAE